MATYKTGASIEVDPISRIEGHLGVKLTTAPAAGASGQPSGYVIEADVHGNLWRGFENFLLGREANDAITFTQRICGVCPVPHGQTSTYAVDAVLGYSEGHITFAGTSGYGVPAKAVLIRNLVLSAEFLMSHLTHFYHLVALDYVQGPATPPWTPFFADEYYHALLLNPGGTKGLPTRFTVGANTFSEKLWDATVTQYVKALRIRRLTFEAGALFAGRMPMTSCFVGGGVTFDGTESIGTRCDKYKTIMSEVGEFIIKEHVPLVLALGALYPNYDNSANATTLAGSFSTLWGLGNKTDTTAVTAGVNCDWGKGVGNFLAWGAFPGVDASGTLGLPGGFKSANSAATGFNFQAHDKADVKSYFLADTGIGSVKANLLECIDQSRYTRSAIDIAAGSINASGYGYPGSVQRTQPARDNGYSYIKAPRWHGLACEVGPFARMVVGGFYPINLTGTLAAGFSKAALGFTGASGVGYDSYTKQPSGAAAPGLDPKMVGVDLAVALVNTGYGLAEVVTYPGGTKTQGTAAQQIDWFLNDDTAVIEGAVATWIIALKGGMSVMDRLRGRALEAFYLIQKMIGGYVPGVAGGSGSWGDDGWIDQLKGLSAGAPSWRTSTYGPSAGTKWGGTEAPRGALMHFCTINSTGNITAYQAVVPTTWNASPKDFDGNRGPIEQAMIGIPFQDVVSDPGTDHVATSYAGLEALRVAHTFDPCIACAVH